VKSTSSFSATDKRGTTGPQMEDESEIRDKLKQKITHH